MKEVENDLMNRIKQLFTPSNSWFKQGKSLERYWLFLEEITNHELKYADVDYWYRLLRNPSETREEVTSTLRYQVLKRDDSTCRICGRKAPQVEIEVDHIVPWACGGPTVADNLQCLCLDCNRGKSGTCF